MELVKHSFLPVNQSYAIIVKRLENWTVINRRLLDLNVELEEEIY